MTPRPSPLLALATFGLVCLAGCTSSSRASSADTPSPGAGLQLAAAPTVALLGDGTRGGLLIVTFRGDQEAALSPTDGCRVELGRGAVPAPLHAGPATQLEGDTVVTQATYRLDADGMAALAKAGSGAELVVTLGGAERSYPWVRSDVLESPRATGRG